MSSQWLKKYGYWTAAGEAFPYQTIDALIDIATGTTQYGVFSSQNNFTVRVNGSYYEAITGEGQLAYGGANNAGDPSSIDGTDASAVIQAALDNLTSGRFVKEKVALKGFLPLNAGLTLDDYTILDMSQATVFLNGGANDTMISSASKTDIEVFGGILDGNKTNQSAGAWQGIRLDGDNMYIHDVFVQNTANHAAFTRGGSRHKVANCRAYNTGGDGFKIGDTMQPVTDGILSDCISVGCADTGLILEQVTRGMIVGGVAYQNKHNIWLADSHRCGILGCVAEDSTEGNIMVYADVSVDEFVVSGCVSKKAGWNGITVHNAHDGSITGNTIIDIDGGGAVFDAIKLQDSTDINISGNYGKDTESNMQWGVREEGTCDRNFIFGNSFRGIVNGAGLECIVLVGANSLAQFNHGAKVNKCEQGEFILKLGDNAGNDKFRIQDSDGVELSSLDSNGNFGVGKGDIIVTDENLGLLLKDRVTGTYYRLRVASGVLSIESA